MIKITRSAKPQILVQMEMVWTDDIKNAKNKKERDLAISKYRHKDIKSALSKMLNGKCAFCESFIENVDFGDIEHFKPKSKFPNEAVKWENLLLSCKKCNGSGQKGNNWPREAQGGLLIKPCNEEPSEFFEFEFDEKTLVTIVRPSNIRGKTSEKVYGLNKISLIKDRNKLVQTYVALSKYYHTDGLAKRLLDEATLDSGEYAAFARMVKKKYT